MVRRSRKTQRSRKTHRRSTRRRSARRQHGGGVAFNGHAFMPVNGMAHVESRSAYDDCSNQVGGACNGGCGMPPALIRQSGGGGGAGGYTIEMTNSLDKVHGGYIVAPCPQRGGSAEASASMSSYPAGFGFDQKGIVETPSGSAHYLDPISYGQQCMGGGGRRSRRSRRSRRHH